MQAQANTLHNIAKCLVWSSRPDVGRHQLEQIATANEEIQLMQQACMNYAASLGCSLDNVDVSCNLQVGCQQHYVIEHCCRLRFVSFSMK